MAFILRHPKKSRIRKQKFLEIMIKGDFRHNKEVWACDKGSLILRKRSKLEILQIVAAIYLVLTAMVL